MTKWILAGLAALALLMPNLALADHSVSSAQRSGSITAAVARSAIRHQFTRSHSLRCWENGAHRVICRTEIPIGVYEIGGVNGAPIRVLPAYAYLCIAVTSRHIFARFTCDELPDHRRIRSTPSPSERSR